MKCQANLRHLLMLRKVLNGTNLRQVFTCDRKSLKYSRNDKTSVIHSKVVHHDLTQIAEYQNSANTKRFGKTTTSGWVDKRPQDPPTWMKILHSDMMKSVHLPQVKKYSHQLTSKDLLLMPVCDLIGIARGLKRTDQEVITALWRRLDDMTSEEMIIVADIFFMNRIWASSYTSALISHVTEMFELLPLTPHQLRRFALHVAHHGNRPPYLQLMFEQHLTQNIDNLHVNDILLWCQFFFVGRASVKSSDLLDCIGAKVIRDFENINHMYLPTLLKTLRLSSYSKISFYKKLGDLIVDTNHFRQSKYLNQIMHFAHGYASICVTHPKLFLYILQECLKEHKNKRVKDFARIIWSCGKLVTDSTQHLSLIHQIVNNLEISHQELMSYPDNLVDLLQGLAYLGIFPPHLLDLLFQPNVIRQILGLKRDREKLPQLLFLHNSVKIECEDYTGQLLSQINIDEINSRLSKFTPEVNATLRKTIYPAVDALRDEIGSESVVCNFFLPHIKNADILLCFDQKQQRFVSPKVVQWEQCNSTKQGKLGTNQFHHIVILLLSRPQTSIDDQILGPTNAKVRQLRKLGHDIIVIPTEEAHQYPLQDKMLTKMDLMNRVNKIISKLNEH